METTFLMSICIWFWQSWLPKQALGGHEQVWWSMLNWLRERWTWTLDTWIYLINEYIHHTDANSQFCEYVSKLKSTYLYIHIYHWPMKSCNKNHGKAVNQIPRSQSWPKESDDPNSTSGLTAWFNRQHEEVEVPTGDDPWRSVNLEPNLGTLPFFWVRSLKLEAWGHLGSLQRIDGHLGSRYFFVWKNQCAWAVCN